MGKGRPSNQLLIRERAVGVIKTCNLGRKAARLSLLYVKERDGTRAIVLDYGDPDVHDLPYLEGCMDR
jgi:hypothetical protein